MMSSLLARCLILLLTGAVKAQTEPTPAAPAPVVTPAPGAAPAAEGQPAVTPPAQAAVPAAAPKPADAAPAAADTAALAAGKAGMSGLPVLAEDGYWVEGAPINEIFQYLARSASVQFFFNNELSGPEYLVTGHLKLDNPRQQMEELAVTYGLSVYEQGSTISLMNEMQLARLPVEVMSYELKYLRGANLNRSMGKQSGGQGGEGGGGGGGQSAAGMADFEKLKSIIKPMLTRDVGQIEFEEKTNTLLVTDNKIKLERVKKLLAEIDKAKKQIMVNVRVLRVKRNQGRQVGVDWSKSLGDAGVTFRASQSLNALFNLPDASGAIVSGTDGNLSTDIEKLYTEGSGLVFSDMQVEAIVRALEDAGLVSQEACPTIITEDNEQGIISIVDRFPVITANVSATSAGQTITEEVRYKIDEQDPSATEEPEKNREIGVTLSVTPTILPDGTVRMKLRPRVAKIVELIAGRSSGGIAGNVYPRVSESTVEAISRIPSGQSLFLGGFYDYSRSEGDNKVPLLGNLPVFGRLFRSDSDKMEQVSLVFIITPRIYDANDPDAAAPVNWDVREFSGMQHDDLADTPLLLPPADGVAGRRPVVSKQPVVVEPLQAAPSGSWMKRLFSRKARAAEVEVPASGGGAPPPRPRGSALNR